MMIKDMASLLACTMQYACLRHGLLMGSREMCLLVSVRLLSFYFGESKFYFLKICPIFVDSALGIFTKYNNYLGVCSGLA